MELVISIVVGVLLVESYAWLPKISAWLLERAVRRLLPEDQARCREEWKAGLDALPNSGLKLLHAFSFTFAPNRINADSMEAKLEQIGDELEVLSNQHARTLQEMGTIIMKVARNREMRKALARVADESVASLRAIEVPASLATGNVGNSRNARDVANAYRNAVNAVEIVDRLVVVAVDRAGDITDSQANRLSARIEQIDFQLRTVRAAHTDVIGLLRKRKLAELPLVLKNLDDDLRTLKGMEVDEMDDGEHATEQREFRRIVAALQSLTAGRSGKSDCNTR